MERGRMKRYKGSVLQKVENILKDSCVTKNIFSTMMQNSLVNSPFMIRTPPHFPQ